LTTIRQEDVEQAEGFWTVFPAFVEWIGPEPFVFCSWGGYDLTQFRIDCRRHHLDLPASFERHVNLKREFARLHKIKACGMKQALDHAGLPLAGTHHRGLDDARNIARLAMLVLPELELAWPS
jgi:inhibitor of KinA sporulation pathway (predicted exonuclease)